MNAAHAFVPFELERFASHWKYRVEYDLARNDVAPMTVRDLLGYDDELELERFAAAQLADPAAGAAADLPERIAATYPGAAAHNVLVTAGTTQAMLLTVLALTSAGDAIATLDPSDGRLRGLTSNLGRIPRALRLDPLRAWQLDPESLASAFAPATALVALSHPNDALGRTLCAQDLRALLDAAAAAGAWVVADERLRGMEHRGDGATPTLFGTYERAVAIDGTSAASGLAGLLVGWIVAPQPAIERMRAWQPYVAGAAPPIGGALAVRALSPSTRQRIAGRTRRIVRAGFEETALWARDRSDVDLVAPDAGAACFVRYRRDEPSAALAERLAREYGTLVAPGAFFGFERYLRVGFGAPLDALREGLHRLGDALDAAD